MRCLFGMIAVLLVTGPALGAGEGESDPVFESTVLPALVEFCWDCHDPEDSEGGILFLDAEKASDVALHRSHWRSVAAQLLNRTMPPARKPQPSVDQRMKIAAWIHQFLRESACDELPYAGYVTARRLNRLEFNHTVRDLVGIDMKFSETLPADSGTGEGFDNNGESLFLPPMLLERYLESAQRIVDAAIVSPRLERVYGERDFVSETTLGRQGVIRNDGETTILTSIFLEDDYVVQIDAVGLSESGRIVVRVDGIDAQSLVIDSRGAFTTEFTLRLARGVHALSFQSVGSGRLALKRIQLRQPAQVVSEEQVRIHEEILGVSVGASPRDLRQGARIRLRRFIRLAFRRPVTVDEVERYMVLYDRAADRGDPFEEAMKLALKGVLVSPDFLFRIEKEPVSVFPQALTDHEIAGRLSYFLWSTMPDEELRTLASLGRLQDASVLRQQTDRLLDDSRSWASKQAFVGQWLGTKDVGGRVAPHHDELKKFYTPEVSADMRAEAVWLFSHLLEEDRSVLELIQSDYLFLTQRLAKFYGYENRYPDLKKDVFTKVSLQDDRRGGLLGLGGVLAMTSHFKEKSPVLRGAWVFDTMLGTPVPPPPADVPSLKEAKKNAGKNRSRREIIEQHRESPSCRACHNLIDPIGFALNNFDYLGRWEDKENGRDIDSLGQLPTGEVFDGPRELKEALLGKKDDFVRQLSRKLLGYALGRGLDDQDECTITQLVETLEINDYRARSLIHGIVGSVPFRSRQLIEEN